MGSIDGSELGRHVVGMSDGRVDGSSVGVKDGAAVIGVSVGVIDGSVVGSVVDMVGIEEDKREG